MKVSEPSIKLFMFLQKGNWKSDEGEKDGKLKIRGEEGNEEGGRKEGKRRGNDRK